MSAPDPPEKLSRREFMRRAAGAGLTLGAAAGLGFGLYDSRPPSASPEEKRPVTLPDYSVPAAKGRMAIVHGGDRIKTLGAALAAVGGLESLIKKGDRVLLKVNAAFALPPQLGATTNPELTAELIRLCRRAGASRVIVTDNPINDPASAFRLSGLEAAVRAAGGRLVLPRAEFFRPTTLPGGRLIKHWPLMAGPLEGITKLIGLAPVKDHHRSGASMTMKNWYGLLGGSRNVFHQDINGIITELALLVRPTLVILDGTMTMMRNGPTGGSLEDLKKTDTMIVSTDQVAADARGAALLGKRPADLPWIGQAGARGAGTVDFEKLRPARLKV
ncbi:MAG: DUF362 domain-containing protein [Proteobacteria bacterium]|nr:DUF362 domain-containing protein [Pseudomonadota bacterium]